MPDADSTGDSEVRPPLRVQGNGPALVLQVPITMLCNIHAPHFNLVRYFLLQGRLNSEEERPQQDRERQECTAVGGPRFCQNG